MASFSSSPPPAKSPAPTAPPETDNPHQTQTPLPPPPGYGVTGILRRWRHEDTLKRVSLGLRVLGFVFSMLAFIIMASNKHGRGRNFDEYEEYRGNIASIHEQHCLKFLDSKKPRSVIYSCFGSSSQVTPPQLIVLGFRGWQLVPTVIPTVAPVEVRRSKWRRSKYYIG
ncbi:hypothetical protein LXL04_028139 [Taraxacum kok-saghyz]